MVKDITKEFKDLLGQQIGRTLSLSAVQSVSQKGKGSLVVGILSNGVIQLTYKNNKGRQQYSFVDYETIKAGSKNIGFLKDFVLCVLQVCELVELSLAKRREIEVPSSYTIVFSILTGDRVKWDIS